MFRSAIRTVAWRHPSLIRSFVRLYQPGGDEYVDLRFDDALAAARLQSFFGGAPE